MSDVQKLYATYAANTARFPALYDELASQLGVSPESVTKIGAGFIPVDEFGQWAWVFPERNAKGKVTGISKRITGKPKYMVPGSKHGLIYAVNHNTKQCEKPSLGWERTSAAYPCTLCGKPDGCLYPKGEYDNPNAVICIRVETGATKSMEFGWLHVFDPARQPLQMQNYSLLLPTDHPILIVEGASDVCAAYDLGFTAVGKYTNKVGPKGGRMLTDLLAGHRVVVLGENDAGAGKTGMESTFARLQKKCPDCTKLMPPEGVKDLRQWVAKGLTQEELLGYITKKGSKVRSDHIFESDIPRAIARRWLKDVWEDSNGQLLIRSFHKRYAQFKDGCYELMDDKRDVRGSVYDYTEGKQFTDTDGGVKPYKATKSKVNDILDAAEKLFPPHQPVPSWIGGGEDRPDPTQLISFENGLLDVDQYITDNKIVFHNPDPRLFSFTRLPYAFDEDLESKLSEDFIADIYDKSADQRRLVNQWFGLNLVPVRMFAKMMFLIGEIRAGKGTLIDMLTYMLGEKNCASTTYQSLAGNFGREPLLGKLAAVMGDARDTNKHDMNKALQYMLMITGGDAVSVNIKHTRELPTIYLPCRFTIGMNILPAFQDDTPACGSRLLVLRHDKSYYGKEDFTLKKRLAKDAMEGKLVNWALRGLKDLYAMGRFVEPAEGKQVLKTFGELASPKAYFTSRCIERDEHGPGVDADYLYGSVWKWWCDREGEAKGKKSTFLHNMRARMPYIVEVMQTRDDGVRRMLMGIKVTDWVDKAQGQG